MICPLEAEARKKASLDSIEKLLTTGEWDFSLLDVLEEQQAPSDEAGPEDMDELVDDKTQPVLVPYHTVIWRGTKSGYEQIQEQLKKDAKEVKL